MRQAATLALREFGREMLLCSNENPSGSSFFGHIEPISRNSTGRLHIKTPAGGVKRAEFLLIAEAESFPEGLSGVYVLCGGERFELVRADKMMPKGGCSHWEGVLRLSGKEEAQNV